MPRERLQKYIANCGYCSRRKAELLIEAGLVQVDGVVVQELGAKIDPARSEVRIHGERIVPPTGLTIALHKPAGFITSTHDTHDRLTVMDLLPRRLADTGVLPAGRLDLETEGLLILTNDGDLQHRITHPRYECEKEYHVELDRAPTAAELAKLAEGIWLRELERTTSPAELTDLHRHPDGSAALKIRIREGMKRQIRRMFEALGMTVTYLRRLSIGGVALGELPRGEWRELTHEEVASLAAAGAGLETSSADLVASDEEEESEGIRIPPPPAASRARAPRSGPAGASGRGGVGRRAQDRARRESESRSRPRPGATPGSGPPRGEGPFPGAGPGRDRERGPGRDGSGGAGPRRGGPRRDGPRPGGPRRDGPRPGGPRR